MNEVEQLKRQNVVMRRALESIVRPHNHSDAHTNHPDDDAGEIKWGQVAACFRAIQPSASGESDSLTCFQCGDGNTPLYCANCAREGYVKVEELGLTIELHKYAIGSLGNATEDHKDGCICWTCTVKRDIERDLDRLQKLMEAR